MYCSSSAQFFPYIFYIYLSANDKNCFNGSFKFQVILARLGHQ